MRCLSASAVLLVLLATTTIIAATPSKFVEMAGQLRRVKCSPKNTTVPVDPYAPIPDWSDVKLDEKVRYLQALIMVDAHVAHYYKNSLDEIKIAVMSLIRNVNLFLYQLDLRITVVDVRVWKSESKKLNDFRDYRNSIITELPEHDFAFILSYHYVGGYAFVDTLCGPLGVSICEFNPNTHHPDKYASLFFHELVHLLGLFHDNSTACECKNQQSEACLRIGGFECDCSVQALANKLPAIQCIQELPKSLAVTTVPMCGNGIIEGDEECDCGPEAYCSKWDCNAVTCEQIISNFLQYLIFILAIMAGIGTGSYLVYNYFILPNKKPQTNQRRTGRIFPSTTTAIPSQVKVEPGKAAPAAAFTKAAPIHPVPARPSIAVTHNSASVHGAQSKISTSKNIAVKKAAPDCPALHNTDRIMELTVPKTSFLSKPKLPPTETAQEVVAGKAILPKDKLTSSAQTQPKSCVVLNKSSAAFSMKPKPKVTVQPNLPSAALKPKLPEKAPVGFVPSRFKSSVVKSKPVPAEKPLEQHEAGKWMNDVPSEMKKEPPRVPISNLVKLFETSKGDNK